MKTELYKNMKTELTNEQSQILIELGVPGTRPTFKLEDLLKILPKYLNYEFEGVKYAADFCFGWNNRFLHYEAGYDLYDMWDKSHHCAEELIDALYELTVWYLKNKKQLEK